jgi:signal transduction histidine kinase
MAVAVVIVCLVTLPSAFVEYFLSSSLRHLTAALAGGLIAGILYCYFCYVITESLSIDLRSDCRKEIDRQGAEAPRVYGIRLRTKIIFAVAIMFFSMVMLVYFLVFCRASMVLTSAFIITTLITVVVLVWLYFRSVKAAFDEILGTIRNVSRGGGELLYLGNNEQEMVEFADLFNDSIRETISLRQDLEAQVDERTRDLSAKAAELRAANEKLQELDSLKSRFLSSVSHELRTPLTSIMGFSKIILRDMKRDVLPALPENVRGRKKADRIASNVEVIQREGDRLKRLINGVLDLAKIESGRMEWHDQSVRLNECVEEAVQVVEGAFNDNPELILRVDLDESLPLIFADRDRIVQVLVNLMSNAAKFTKAGEVAVFAVRNSDGWVRVSVSDTGPGIQPEDLERIFDRFHQGGGKEGKPLGTGLGLAICKEIVEHYGGEIRAESGIGAGSRFIFSLPAGNNH